MNDIQIQPVTEIIRLEKTSRNHRLDDSLFSKDLAPHYMKLAGQLATSELVPKCFRGKPQDLFLCWSMGYQVGLTPEQSMQCIAVINGKPAMWGDDMLALCMSHRDFDDIIETPIIKNDAITGFTCTVKRKGKADKESVFTLDMAKKAGLLAKGGVWTQYPERMLKLRARGFGLRDAFPDALKGIKPREEVEDYNLDNDLTPIAGAKLSRTNKLKNEILAQRSVDNADLVYGCVVADQYMVPIEEASENEEHGNQAPDSKQEAQLRLEIKKLIEEKVFTPERLANALEYYDFKSIDALPVQECQHFIQQLSKI